MLKLINLIRTKRLKPDASRAERLSMMVGNQASGGQEELSEAFQEPDIEASADESEDADLDDDSGPPGGLTTIWRHSGSSPGTWRRIFCGICIALQVSCMLLTLHLQRTGCYVADLLLSIW